MAFNNNSYVEYNNILNEFENNYEKIKKSRHLINTIGKEFINQGMSLYSTTNDLSTKEFVLTKLIDIIPNEPAFHYYMGYSFKDVNAYKALPYFQKSYELNPNNIENMIDYCNLLFINGETKKILDMDKINPYSDFLKDVRFLTIVVNSKYKEHYYKDLLNQLLYIIKEKSKYTAITQHDKEWKFSNYLNIGQIYSSLGDYEKSQIYTKKAFDLSIKYDLNIEFKMNGLSNLIALANYDYVDLFEYYNKALMIYYLIKKYIIFIVEIMIKYVSDTYQVIFRIMQYLILFHQLLKIMIHVNLKCIFFIISLYF